MYSSNQEFYDHIDEVVDALRSSGHTADAEKINSLLRKVAWTTSSELLGELRILFNQVLKSNKTLSSSNASDIKNLIIAIDKIGSNKKWWRFW